MATMQKAQGDTLQGPEIDIPVEIGGDRPKIRNASNMMMRTDLLVPLGICLRIMLLYIDTFSLSSFLRLL